MERTRPDFCRSPHQIDPSDPGAWRQWHYWNVASQLFKVGLSKGKNVLTVSVVRNGKMNLAYFNLEPAPPKCKLSAIQLNVSRKPVACGTVTEHLPCLSESVFADVVMCASRLSSAGACNVSACNVPLASRPKSISTSRSAAASLFRMITEVFPPGRFTAYAIALTPTSCSLVKKSVFNSVPPLNEPANLSPYATGSIT